MFSDASTWNTRFLSNYRSQSTKIRKSQGSSLPMNLVLNRCSTSYVKICPINFLWIELKKRTVSSAVVIFRPIILSDLLGCLLVTFQVPLYPGFVEGSPSSSADPSLENRPKNTSHLVIWRITLLRNGKKSQRLESAYG